MSTDITLKSFNTKVPNESLMLRFEWMGDHLGNCVLLAFPDPTQVGNAVSLSPKSG